MSGAHASLADALEYGLRLGPAAHGLVGIRQRSIELRESSGPLLQGGQVSLDGVTSFAEAIELYGDSLELSRLVFWQEA